MRIGGLPVEACCRFVHGRLPKDARCGQGAFRVQAAPPKDSFDSPVDTRSSALPKHDSRLLFAPPPILCRCRNGAALQEAPEGSRRHPHLGLALFDRSRSRSVLRSFAALSMLRVEVALQDMHCQRLEPDDVLP